MEQHILKTLQFLKNNFCLCVFIRMHIDTTGNFQHFCQLILSTKHGHLTLTLLQSHCLTELWKHYHLTALQLEERYLCYQKMQK